MSRNTEKSQSALHRFQAFKNKEAGVLESNPNLRPKYVQSVDSLPQAEKWRSTIISEISYKLTRIQEPDINELQIRDINDDLNKLFKEKRAWEYHIKDLGGNDHLKYGNKLFNTGVVGKETHVELRNYRYFGRAKELPEIRDYLLEKEKLNERKRSNIPKAKDEIDELKKREERLSPSYYGYYDELDGYGNKTISSNKVEILNEVNAILGYEIVSPSAFEEKDTNDCNDNEYVNLRPNTKKSSLIRDTSYLDSYQTSVPSDREVEDWIIQKRKQDLLNRLTANQKF